MTQQEMFSGMTEEQTAPPQAPTKAPTKPRITLKAKREAAQTFSALIREKVVQDEEYEPPEGALRVLQALQFDINTADSKKK